MPRSAEPMPPSPTGRVSGETYFEFTAIGRQVRVAAIDADTNVEVVVMGPATATQAQLQTLALNKLRRRLRTLGD